MLVVFHSKISAEVLMFAKDALPILRAAGRSYPDALPERGVITHEQLDDAIAGIEAAIAADTHSDYEDEDEHAENKLHPISRKVGLRQRAFPLLAMLRQAREHGDDVTWGPAPVW